MKRFLRDGRGTSALEFAIMAPVFVALVVAVFNAGYAAYSAAAVRSAIQRSSRALILTPSTTAATLKSNATSLLVKVPIDNLTVTVTTETVTAQEQIKRVSWSYDYLLSLPLISKQTLAFSSSIVVPMAPTF